MLAPVACELVLILFYLLDVNGWNCDGVMEEVLEKKNALALAIVPTYTTSNGTQQSLRKALGALKDTTKVRLAKVNSEHKDLDIAIVKATNHMERPTKEKHIRTIFAATSATRPWADESHTTERENMQGVECHPVRIHF
eukprot:Gb_38168 [translate_table: standard]